MNKPPAVKAAALNANYFSPQPFWIDERPSYYGVPVPLRQFYSGNILWTNIGGRGAGTSTFYNFGNAKDGYDVWNMYDPQNTLLAGLSHGFSSVNSYRDYWFHCGVSG